MSFSYLKTELALVCRCCTFLCAFLALMMGVSLTERPSVQTADMLTKANYSLGFFIMEGDWI